MRDPFFTILNEPEPAPEAGGGGPQAEPSAPSPEPPAAPAPAGPAEPWSGPSQEEWQAMTQFQQSAMPVLQELAQALQGGPPQQQPEQPAAPEPQQPPFDPFNPESVQSYIDTVAQQKAEALLEPYMGVLGLTASQTGEQLARDALNGLQSELGQFDQDAALMVASGLLDQGASPEQALRQAAQYVVDYEKRIRDTAQTAFAQNTVEPRLPGNQPGGQPPGGAPANEIQRVPVGPGKYEKAVENWVANRRPTMPVG